MKSSIQAIIAFPITVAILLIFVVPAESQQGWQPVGTPMGDLIRGHEDTFPTMHGAWEHDPTTGECVYIPPPPQYDRYPAPCPPGMFSSITPRATAADRAPTIPIMDTDPAYFRSCQPLVEQQSSQHANRQSYRSTKMLTVQSGPDYSTTLNGIKSHDYCVGVAFIHNDGKSYDLTYLRCEIWPDRTTEISRDPCEAPSIAVWNSFKRLAGELLPDMTADRWVKPYDTGIPASLEALQTRNKR
jgi:hypothetical protein